MERIIKAHRSIFSQYADPRTSDYLLTNGFLILGIIAVYLLLVKKVLPKFMQNRKAFEFSKLLVVYNIAQVVTNAYIFYGLSPFILQSNFVCEVLDTSDLSKEALHIVHIGYVYFITKLVDLLDTIFIVLRKRDRQVTFLHVFHHTSMVFFGWLGYTYLPGGHTAYSVFLNSFVHVTMYTYYGLTAYNSKYKESIWWKKHLTQVQLVQFILGIAFYMGPVVTKGCGYSWTFSLLSCILASLFFILFSNFYYKTYLVKKAK